MAAVYVATICYRRFVFPRLKAFEAKVSFVAARATNFVDFQFLWFNDTALAERALFTAHQVKQNKLGETLIKLSLLFDSKNAHFLA